MAPPKKPLSHKEIWDDSALIDSWNDALKEYEKYHSIHKNGGNVEDLLKSHETTDAKDETKETHPLEADSEMRTGAEAEAAISQDSDETQNGRQENGTSSSQHSHPLGGGPGPGGLLGSGELRTNPGPL
ncbi:hypothetical protein Daesc_003469 [Daldinia eschscholtzii]|uniref:Survival Motor Neuron Gemin2-binding domain-containing protein n=1 Tax=Daldinia eschscholtzii TaxID=292717 RepID=A0AAX6MT77_9PEZI